MIQYRCFNPRVVASLDEVKRLEDYTSIMALRSTVSIPVAGGPEDYKPRSGAPKEGPNTLPPGHGPSTLPPQGQKSGPGPNLITMAAVDIRLQ